SASRSWYLRSPSGRQAGSSCAVAGARPAEPVGPPSSRRRPRRTFSWGEELLQDGRERRRRDVVGLTGKRAEARAWDDFREPLGRRAEHGHGLLATQHERRYREYGRPLGGWREISHHRRVVG